MRVFMTVFAFVFLMSGNVLAGSEYDKCIKEENALKAEESSNCSGFNYTFNPSACFATRKALKKYTSTDKCKKIGITEHVDFNIPAVIPVAQPGNIEKIGSDTPAEVKTPELRALQQESTYNQLKDENQRLKAEIIRLKTENQLLREKHP
jgi:hypothetical protein